MPHSQPTALQQTVCKFHLDPQYHIFHWGSTILGDSVLWFLLISFDFGEMTFMLWSFERKHPASTDGMYLCYRKQGFLPRTSYLCRLRNGSPCRVLLISTHLKRNGCFALSGNWSSIYGTRNESGGADRSCSFIGTAPSKTSWEVISADGSWRLVH